MGHSYAYIVYIDVVKGVGRHVEIPLRRHSIRRHTSVHPR
jgi:hypothetical protein